MATTMRYGLNKVMAFSWTGVETLRVFIDGEMSTWLNCHNDMEGLYIFAAMILG